jgi:hypothetical protein
MHLNMHVTRGLVDCSGRIKDINAIFGGMKVFRGR